MLEHLTAVIFILRIKKLEFTVRNEIQTSHYEYELLHNQSYEQLHPQNSVNAYGQAAVQGQEDRADTGFNTNGCGLQVYSESEGIKPEFSEGVKPESSEGVKLESSEDALADDSTNCSSVAEITEKALASGLEIVSAGGLNHRSRNETICMEYGNSQSEDTADSSKENSTGQVVRDNGSLGRPLKEKSNNLRSHMTAVDVEDDNIQSKRDDLRQKLKCGKVEDLRQRLHSRRRGTDNFLTDAVRGIRTSHSQSRSEEIRRHRRSHLKDVCPPRSSCSSSKDRGTSKRARSSSKDRETSRKARSSSKDRGTSKRSRRERTPESSCRLQLQSSEKRNVHKRKHSSSPYGRERRRRSRHSPYRTTTERSSRKNHQASHSPSQRLSRSSLERKSVNRRLLKPKEQQPSHSLKSLEQRSVRCRSSLELYEAPHSESKESDTVSVASDITLGSLDNVCLYVDLDGDFGESSEVTVGSPEDGELCSLEDGEIRDLDLLSDLEHSSDKCSDSEISSVRDENASPSCNDYADKVSNNFCESYNHSQDDSTRASPSGSPNTLHSFKSYDDAAPTPNLESYSRDDASSDGTPVCPNAPQSHSPFDDASQRKGISLHLSNQTITPEPPTSSHDALPELTNAPDPLQSCSNNCNISLTAPISSHDDASPSTPDPLQSCSNDCNISPAAPISSHDDASPSTPDPLQSCSNNCNTSLTAPISSHDDAFPSTLDPLQSCSNDCNTSPAAPTSSHDDELTDTPDARMSSLHDSCDDGTNPDPLQSCSGNCTSSIIYKSTRNKPESLHFCDDDDDDNDASIKTPEPTIPESLNTSQGNAILDHTRQLGCDTPSASELLDHDNGVIDHTSSPRQLRCNTPSDSYKPTTPELLYDGSFYSFPFISDHISTTENPVTPSSSPTPNHTPNAHFHSCEFGCVDNDDSCEEEFDSLTTLDSISCSPNLKPPVSTDLVPGDGRFDEELEEGEISDSSDEIEDHTKSGSIQQGGTNSLDVHGETVNFTSHRSSETTSKRRISEPSRKEGNISDPGSHMKHRISTACPPTDLNDIDKKISRVLPPDSLHHRLNGKSRERNHRVSLSLDEYIEREEHRRRRTSSHHRSRSPHSSHRRQRRTSRDDGSNSKSRTHIHSHHRTHSPHSRPRHHHRL